MTDIASLQEKLEKAKAEAEKLAQQIEEARNRQFTELPRQVGLETVDDLIKALLEHASPRMKSALRGVLSGNSAAEAPKTPRAKPAAAAGKRTRARITPELRQKVIDALKEGRLTGAEIAKEFGISLPSVQNIKKAAGLVRKAE